MDCDSPLITSRFDLQHSPPDTLSYQLSNFSIEPNDSFITISPKVASNTANFDLDVGKTPTKIRMVSTDTEDTDAENLLETMRDSSPQLRNSSNPDEESLCDNVNRSRYKSSSSHTVADQVEEPCHNNLSEESQVQSSSSILSYPDKSYCNNVTNENECLKQQGNPYHNEMSLIEEEKKYITEEVAIEDKMIIDGEMNGVIKHNGSFDNVEDNGQSDNREIVEGKLSIKMHLNNKNEDDNSHCYSWEDEIIDFHNEPFENEDNMMQKIHTNEETSFMIHKKQLEKEGFIIQETNLNENMSCLIQKEQSENENHAKQKTNMNEESLEKKRHILQRINLNDVNYTIDDQSPIDLHCCSQSENKCGFHRIYDLLDKENYNQDSISNFELLKDPIPKEFSGISNQREQINSLQDRLSPTDYIRSSDRFSKDGISPAPSPPSLLSQTTLAMMPQSAWDTLPSFNVSTLDSEVLNDDLL
ncbi:hypothetical protein C1645_319966 [Glomus cerebriforme]|uniref:Uncharacterized protein n=1 Tax=Glomus cerebriforme TaxID=658196 RepID=A0A397SKI5_9GLOM|nr:hypothetical protein C1645_319966 [Glomus cerebriforme]